MDDVARRDPDRTLLEVDGCSSTYAEINIAVDRLAARLQADHEDKHPIVAVRCSGTWETVVAMLAVQRAGAVLVPIDPTAPEPRVIAMLDQVRPVLLLSDVAGDERLPVPTGHPRTHVAEVRPAGREASPATLAAILFTSGSSGEPKGVMLGPDHWAEWSVLVPRMLARCGLPVGRHAIITVGTAGFTVAWMAGVVAVGGTIVAYELREQGLSPFGSWLAESQASNLTIVPTVLRSVLSTFKAGQVFDCLRLVAIGGEAPTWDDVRALSGHLPAGAFVHGVLAQTEVQISWLRVSIDDDLRTGAAGPLPAGEAMPDRAISILSPNGTPVVRGQEGEIVVDTPVAALGYWLQPDLTAEVFSDLPNGERRVRTGDRGRIGADGLLEHLGRIDRVVKVSGNRIDLGDVEAALRSLVGVADAAVTTFVSAVGHDRLAAYVVATPGSNLHPQLVRAALARRLSAYMLPSTIDVLAELPRLSGGKLDRLRLPGPAVQGVTPAPATELERQIADLMSTVLGVSVGMTDDFFALGGDSLAATELFVKLEHDFGIDRPVTLLVEAPTAAALAAAIASQTDDPWQVLFPIAARGELPPLFVIHSGYGEILYARRLLGGLGASQPLYALRPRALNGLVPAQSSIEAVAADYLAAVRLVHPHGPYLFYGYSLGGCIAYEMACQVQAAGEDVAFLGIGDTPSPGTTYGALARMGRRMTQMRTLPSREATRLAADLTKRLAGRTARQAGDRITKSAEWRRRRRIEQDIQANRPVAIEKRGEFVLETYVALFVRYRPTNHYQGPVLFLRARHDIPEPPDLGWSRWVSGPIEVVELDLEHSEIHLMAGSEAIARLLRDRIDASLST